MRRHHPNREGGAPDAAPTQEDTMSADFDLIAIGSGPAGQRAAIQAAKLGARAAIIERGPLGGVSTNTGTIPSKTLREVVVALAAAGRRHRDVSVEDVRARALPVLEREREVVRDQLRRNGVAMIWGAARFVDPHTLAVRGPAGEERRVSAPHILIAVGSRPAHQHGVDLARGREVGTD